MTDVRSATYQEALAAVIDVPELDPALRPCPAGADDGFATAEEEEEGAVDDDAEATCQFNPREASYPADVPPRRGR